tara:strand:- start:93 stop:602 length:510 start_codon:yes stop_codon:yes gene_type:complete
MKNNLKFFFILVLTISLGSCSDDSNSLNKGEVESKTETQETPDFRAIFFNENNSDQKAPILYTITTESDLVSADGGCYVVNVRVYTTHISTGNKYLVASGNSEVCGKNSQTNMKSGNSTCNGQLKDGNYVFDDGVTDHICLYEILSKNEEVYEQYKKSVNTTISNMKTI